MLISRGLPQHLDSRVWNSHYIVGDCCADAKPAVESTLTSAKAFLTSNTKFCLDNMVPFTKMNEEPSLYSCTAR